MIRPARLDDAEALAETHIRSWQAACRGLVPDATLDGMVVAERAEGWRRLLQDGQQTFVLVEAERLWGYMSCGPCRDPDLVKEGELYGIYVHPEGWLRGLGRALFARCVDELAAAGFAQLSLWVLRDSHPARAFYARVGLEADGAERESEYEGITLSEVRYRMALTGPRSGA